MLFEKHCCRDKQSSRKGKACSIHQEAVPVQTKKDTKTATIQTAIMNSLMEGESIVFFDSKNRTLDHHVSQWAKGLKYQLAHIKAEDLSADKSITELSNNKCFWHLDSAWETFQTFPGKNNDTLKTLKRVITELAQAADRSPDGLKVPVNIIVDDISMLRFAMSDTAEGFDTFLATMQRRENWHLNIMTFIS